MRFSKLRLFLICWLLLLPVGVFAEGGERELKTDTKEALDAVLLLDSSGSMLLTDPARLRDEGAKLFLQFLRTGDQLGIVDFSNGATIVRALSAFDPKNVEDASKAIAAIETKGEYTDLLAAIKTAIELLKQNGRPDASHVIVLLSDGKLEPDPKVRTTEAAINELIQDILPDLKAQGTKIYTLAFSDLADRDLLGQIALGTEGEKWFTPTAESIHQSFADMFLSVKKPQMLPLTGKGFAIDSNIDEATFYVNKQTDGHQEESEVRIVSPQGKEYTAVDANDQFRWFKSQKFDVITILKPEVGNWQLLGLPNKEGFATVLTNLKLVTDWPTTVEAEQVVLLQARLYDGKKPVALPQMTGAIRYALQVTPTDKISEPVLRELLVDDGTKGDLISGDGIFSLKVTLAEPGEYRLRTIALAPTFERQQEMPFRVRPPMVALKVISAEENAAGHADHGETHHSDGGEGAHQAVDPHGEGAADSHQEKSDHHEESAKEKPQQEAAGPQIIQAVLSDETSSLKSLQIKMSAVHADRTRYSLPMSKSDHEGLLYEVGTLLLPKAGEYTLQATVTGETRAGKKEKYDSKAIKFVKAEGEAAAATVEVEKPVEKKEPEGFPIVGLILVTIVNGVAGGLGMTLLAKKKSGTPIEVPKVDDGGALMAEIENLEKVASATAVDFNDPRLVPFFVSSDKPKEPPAAPPPAVESETVPEGGEGPPSEEPPGDPSPQADGPSPEEDV